MIVKVCGMRDAQNIREIENLGIDWMGFIFYSKSPRAVNDMLGYIPKKVKRVGVFVDELIEIILETEMLFRLDMVQLHGNESPELCRQLKSTGTEIIKAFSIEDEFPAEKVNDYDGVCDYFLFDTKTHLHGGSGKKFNWDVLSDYHGDTPFLLSGGISMDDVEKILAFAHPQFIGIDINSRFEISPALKDVEQIKQFLGKIRKQI